jgi:hypothetical protein
MRENEAFLYKNAKDAYDELVELANDAIDLVTAPSAGRKPLESHAAEALFCFTNHVLMPSSGAIHVNALVGNLLASLMQLRLAVESLGKCYLADKHYSHLPFFQERLHTLEESTRNRRQSISALLAEFDAQIGVTEGLALLWRNLSQTWVHARGVVDQVVTQVVERSDVPPWALVIPMSYSRHDLSALNWMASQVAIHPRILRSAVQWDWKGC